MTKIKIASPVQGLDTSTAIGPLVLNFKDSVAEVDSDALTPGVRKYLERNGSGIGGDEPTGREIRLGQAEPADPRKASAVRVGTPTRDAAVDPRDKDFLAPINAGKKGKKGNPHSSNVVSPEIHASEGVRPVKGGPVHVDDPGAQDASEKGHAAAATDGTAVTLTDEERELLGLDDLDEAEADADADLTGDQDPDGTQGQGDPDSESEGPSDADSPADAETPAAELKGQGLHDALEAAGLPTTGSADEKRARLAEHRGEA